MRVACCSMRVACSVLRNRRNACCANACCCVFAFLFEKKRYRGKQRKWERRRWDLSQREERREEGRGGGKEGKWKARRRRAHLLEGAKLGREGAPARCARARRAALYRERAASSVKHANHRFRCALAFYRPRASPISRQQSCCAAYSCLCSCDQRSSVTRLSEGLPILSSHHSDALGRHRIVAIFYSPNGQHSHHLV